MEKIHLAFSSDIAGFEGKPENVLSFYSEILSLLKETGRENLGLEVIAWKHSYKNFLEAKDSLGYQIIGWHGPVGIATWWEHGIKAQLRNKAFNTALISSEELFELGQPPFSGYLLIHETETERKGFWDLINKAKNKSVKLLLENVDHPGSLMETVKKVERLISLGIKAGIMIDLGHLLLENPDYQRKMKKKMFIPLWSKILADTTEALSYLPLAGFHIPIGSIDDCLPLVLMDDYLWRELALLIDKNPQIQYLTIENIHRCCLMSLKEKDAVRLRERSRQIIQTFIETGVIR